MANRLICFWTAAMALLAPAEAWTATQSNPPTTTEDSVSLDEALSFLLRDGLQARAVLRERGERQRADAFWGSISRFAAAVRDSDPDDHPMFFPIIAGFRTAIADSVIGPPDPDQGAVDSIQASLEEQILIQTAPGATPGSRGGVQLRVGAIRNNRPVSGLYVWLDLACCVPKRGGTSNSLPGVTPTLATVGPGRYVVRLMRGSQQVGGRIATIGRQGTQETLTVQVEQR